MSSKLSPRGRVAALGLGLLLAATLIGCGGDPGPRRMAVEGTVTLNDQPLPTGIVRFIPMPANPGPGASAPIKDGKFTFDAHTGPIVGEHRIEIEATDYQGVALDDEAAYEKAAKTNPAQLVKQNPIPPIYNRQSTLKETVKGEGENKFDFKLMGPKT